MPLTNEIHHVGLSTRRLDLMVAFYVDVFGFAVLRRAAWERGTPEIDALVGLRDSAAHYVMLSRGSARIELHAYSSPTPGPTDPERRVCDPGQSHFCFGVTDIDAEYERLRAAGMRFHSPPFPSVDRAEPGTSRVAYGRDPDGNVIELLEELDAVR